MSGSAILHNECNAVTENYAYGQAPVSLQSVSSIYECGYFWKRGGRVYHSIHRGTFGSNREVIVKKAWLNGRTNSVIHDELLSNDRNKTELLQYNPSIVRFFFSDVLNLSVDLYMEKYETNLSDYVNYAGFSKIYDKYSPVSVMEQLLQTLTFLESHRIFHRDLRLKNMFIHLTGGKSIAGLFCVIKTLFFRGKVDFQTWRLQVRILRKHYHGPIQCRGHQRSKSRCSDLLQHFQEKRLYVNRD